MQFTIAPLPAAPIAPAARPIRQESAKIFVRGLTIDARIGVYDHELTVPEFSMGYRWDIVVDGPDATWFEPEGEH